MGVAGAHGVSSDTGVVESEGVDGRLEPFFFFGAASAGDASEVSCSTLHSEAGRIANCGDG